MASNASFWVAVVSAVAAWVAALFAYLSARTSKRSLQLAEMQDKRRKPELIPYLSIAYYKPAPSDKYSVYAFSISICNPSDIDNAIAFLELQVSYTLPEGTIMTLKVPHDPKLSINFNDIEHVHFTIPNPIGAHQTIAGWVFFNIDNTLITDFDIDSYKLVITDSHDVSCHLEPIIVREFVDEKEMAKRNSQVS